MVLTKEELISALKDEIRILVHLAGKVDPNQLDYRPTPKQRSTLELLRYLAIMGPVQVALIQFNAFNQASLSSRWSAAEANVKELDFDQTLAIIRQQADEYARLLGDWSEADFRGGIDFFGTSATRGSLLVRLVLNAHAAYRTQLFCYLKSCGREELNTLNLWGGVDSAKVAP